jgi:TonB family protein
MTQPGVLLLFLALVSPSGALAQQRTAGWGKEWPQRFKGADPSERAQLVWGLVLSGNTPRVVQGLGAAIPALITALDDSHEEVVGGALWVLCTLPDKAAAAACARANDTPPRPLARSRSYYPQDAFDRGLEGTVQVGLLIASDGTVVHAEVLKSVEGLDRAAIHCVRRWKFKPAERHGQPVPSFGLAPVQCRIY